MLPLMLFALAASSLLPSVDSGQPLALHRGFLFVDVRINHRGPFRMALDTGATSCMLTPAAASVAGLVPDQRIILTTASGERTIPGVRGTNLQVGTVSLDGIEVLVDTLSAIREVDPRVDGVLGQSFLGRVAYLIDYRRRRLLLDAAADRGAQNLGAPFAVTKSFDRLLIPVAVAGTARDYRMVLDTGAQNLVLSCGGDCPPAPVASTARLRTNTGERLARRTTLSGVSIGGMSFPPAEAIFTAPPALAGQGDGLLPGSWFSAVYVSRGGALVRLER